MNVLEIQSRIVGLKTRLGKPAPRANGQLLKSLHEKGDIDGMVRVVRDSMGLNFRVKIAKWNPGKPEGMRANAPAWMEWDNPTPIFGSPAFSRMVPQLSLRKSYIAEATWGALSVGISHEFAHIVLESTGHPLRKDEKMVDLTAMYLGYAECFAVHGEYPITPERAREERKLRGNVDPMADMLDRLEQPIIRVGYLDVEERKYASSLITYYRDGE